MQGRIIVKNLFIIVHLFFLVVIHVTFKLYDEKVGMVEHNYGVTCIAQYLYEHIGYFMLSFDIFVGLQLRVIAKGEVIQ